MSRGPALSSRQIPWFMLGLGAMFLALGALPLLASLGLVSNDFSTTEAAEGILLGSGLVYVGIAGGLFWKHSRLEPGTREYEEYHRQKDWHLHLTQTSVAYWLGMGTLLAGLVVLNVAEGPQGRCYKYAPKPCLFTLSPSGGLEFVGTVLLIAGPVSLLLFGIWKLARWRRDRAEDRPVRKWLDGEGPLE